MGILIVSLSALLVNLPLGALRSRYQRFTLKWWLLIHASIPLIIALRIWLDTPLAFIPFFIGCAVLGQFLGGRLLSTVKK